MFTTEIPLAQALRMDTKTGSLSSTCSKAICNKYFGDGTPQGVLSAELGASDNQLVVATNAEFAPFEYKEGEAYYGIDMEIAALLAEKLGNSEKAEELIALIKDKVVSCKVYNTQNNAYSLRNNRCKSCTVNAHIEKKNKYGVKNNVADCTDNY